MTFPRFDPVAAERRHALRARFGIEPSEEMRLNDDGSATVWPRDDRHDWSIRWPVDQQMQAGD